MTDEAEELNEDGSEGADDKVVAEEKPDEEAIRLEEEGPKKGQRVILRDKAQLGGRTQYEVLGVKGNTIYLRGITMPGFLYEIPRGRLEAGNVQLPSMKETWYGWFIKGEERPNLIFGNERDKILEGLGVTLKD